MSSPRGRTTAIFACAAFALGSQELASARQSFEAPATATAGDDRDPSDPPATGGTKNPNTPGGTYRGPTDQLKWPGGSGGANRNPSPSKPAISRPKAPGGAAPGGTGRGRPGAGVSGTRGIEGFGGKRASRTDALDSWEIWWEQNGYRFAEARLLPDEPITLAGTLAGDSIGVGARDVQSRSRFSDDLVRREILPALETVLGGRDPELLEASVIAFAQCCPLLDSNKAATALVPILSIARRSLQVKTILALGLTRSRVALPHLIGIMLDQKQGRAALGTSSTISDDLRGAAALALGCLHEPEAIDELERAIFDTKRSAVQTKAMAVRALGNLERRRDRATALLLDVLRNPSFADEVRAEAPLALRRLDAVIALPALAKLVASDKTPPRLAESCVIALGELVSPAAATTVEWLRDAARQHSSASIRFFSLIALGEIASRAVASEPQANRAFATALTGLLIGEIRSPSRTGNAPWAGLAASIAARRLEGFDPVRADAVAALRARLAVESNASHRGAYALALALAGDPQSAPLLLTELTERRDPQFMPYAALALGILEHAPARAALRGLALDDSDPRIVRQAASALALLGDAELSTSLTDALEASRNLDALAALSRAIGVLGDRDALIRIADLARDPSRPEALRAGACLALGMLGERRGKALRADVLGDVNYRCDSTAVETLLAIDS